LLYNLNS